MIESHSLHSAIRPMYVRKICAVSRHSILVIQVVVNLTEMTASVKQTVLDAITSLHPGGSTNLWDGLKTGMNLLNEGFTKASGADISPSDRLSTLFILTDGMPNVNPPRGHIPMLKAYLDAHPTSQQFSISTFGFGYS